METSSPHTSILKRLNTDSKRQQAPVQNIKLSKAAPHKAGSSLPSRSQEAVVGRDPPWYTELEKDRRTGIVRPDRLDVIKNQMDLDMNETKMRPSFEQIYMQLAHALAERSTCSRLNVGTVITSTDYRKVLAVGYNGNATGLPNRCDRTEAGNCGCLHSEENAVINCDSPRSMEKHVFVTHLPCVACSKRLINLGGVRKIFYASDYRSKDSLEVLASVGIEVIHLGSGPV